MAIDIVFCCLCLFIITVYNKVPGIIWKMLTKAQSDTDKPRQKQKTKAAADQVDPSGRFAPPFVYCDATLFTATNPREHKTKAAAGQVDPPKLFTARNPREHMRNAFLEYMAILEGTIKVNRMTCMNIMHAFQRGQGVLKAMVEDSEAAIYNNNTGEVILGELSECMAAYNFTYGFVDLDEKITARLGRKVFKAPVSDPIVITAKCTKIMLEGRILKRAQTAWKSWYSFPTPKITWVNGVPGCGKTTWVIRQFQDGLDIVATTTREAAKELKEKLCQRDRSAASNRVRTLASLLVNAIRVPVQRLIVDEALMNHFGSIVLAAMLTKPKEIVLIGDIHQLPYIDRENLFEMLYKQPNLITSISVELLCTHRCPMDVAYALSEVYSGIYSSKTRVRSLTLKPYTGMQIAYTAPNTLFLVHTQKEKASLIKMGFGSGKGSETLTIHEAQGLTYETVVIIQSKCEKLQLHSSIDHAVVAVSRHTGTCTYYTDMSKDAIGSFMTRAINASTDAIIVYNSLMARKYGNYKVMADIFSGQANTYYSDLTLSRHPACVTASRLQDEDFNTERSWRDQWKEAMKGTPEEELDPTSKPKGFNLPRKDWCRLNRLWTGHGRCNYLRHKWGWFESPLCDCGIEDQTMEHNIIQRCPLRAYQGSPDDLRKLTPEALTWLRTLDVD